MTTHDSDIPLYSIGTAARMLDVSVQTLRMYESEGLIAPFKTSGRQRLYSKADIERFECIRKAINEEKISIGGMKRIHAMIPCWDIVKCSEQDRSVCPAYKGHSGGCWTYKHTLTVCAAKECRLCDVYKRASNCGEIKEAITRRVAQ
ncbi:MAG: MerR family transcriptional regulator [Ignavibacteriales bacterium]|nr:MerR family transcriptional regulator [Ignavibacteriales bacterium]